MSNHIKMVNCLIFGNDGTIAIGTECRTQAELRVLLSDRIANGDSFPAERCARVPAEDYDAACGRTATR